MKAVRLFIAFGILLAAILFGDAVPVSAQRDILETLRTIASIVFGVVGAWIALVYPKALEDLLKPDEGLVPRASDIERLLRPLLYSTCVLAFTLCFDFIYVVMISLAIDTMYVGTIRKISLFLVTGMTILEVWALALTLGPTDAIRQELRLLQERRRYVQQLRSRAGKDEE